VKRGLVKAAPQDLEKRKSRNEKRDHRKSVGDRSLKPGKAGKNKRASWKMIAALNGAVLPSGICGTSGKKIEKRLRNSRKKVPEWGRGEGRQKDIQEGRES